jgi:hypothetical protein
LIFLKNYDIIIIENKKEVNIMRIVNKEMYCDNCKERIELGKWGYDKRIGWVFPAETTEGRKMLCWECIEVYNVLNRLPTIEEKEAGWYVVSKRENK